MSSILSDALLILDSNGHPTTEGSHQVDLPHGRGTSSGTVPAPAAGSGPPPHVAPPAAREGARRTFGGNQYWKVPGGHLVYNAADESIDAHCDHPDHVDPRNRCRINRKRFACKRGLKDAQGRPIGFLLAWLAAAPNADSAFSHKKLAKTKDLHPDELELFSRGKRCAGRQWVKTNRLNDLLALERPRRDGEESEPEGIP